MVEHQPAAAAPAPDVVITKKRSRPSSHRSRSRPSKQQNRADDDDESSEKQPQTMVPIGASEFCAMMNASSSNKTNAQLKCMALQRFIFTIRRDRRLAFSSSSSEYSNNNIENDDDEDNEDDTDDENDNDGTSKEDNGSSSTDGDDDSSRTSNVSSTTPMEEQEPLPPSPRKQQTFKESWMEDSAAYNVPFVGTAVAKQTAPVVVGMWPTGLLAKYLTVSPLAVELLASTTMDEFCVANNNSNTTKSSDGASAPRNSASGSTKNKAQAKADREKNEAVTKAYIEAVAELVTAVSGRTTTTKPESSSSTATPDQHSLFLPTLVTKRLPGFVTLLAEARSDGPWAASLLTLLRHVVATSKQTARHVARVLEQSLPPFVLPSLVRRPAPRPTATATKASLLPALKLKHRRCCRTHRAALKLTLQLAETNDAVVRSIISTPATTSTTTTSNTGNSSTKSGSGSGSSRRPGLLFVAMQRGLPDRPNAVTERLCQALQMNHHRSSSSSWPQRLRDDVVSSTECLQTLVRYSVLAAPALIRHEDVLACVDDYNMYTSSGDTAEEENPDDDNPSAQKTCSPPPLGVEARRLLFSLLVDPKFVQHRDPSVLVKVALVPLWDDSNLATVQFLLRVLHTTTTTLWPALFRRIQATPSPSGGWVAAVRWHSLGTLLRDGPRAAQCCGGGVVTDDTREESILLAVLPQAIKKQTLVQAWQSSSTTTPLLALEAYKLYCLVLLRCQQWLDDLGDDAMNQWEKITVCLVQRLPDRQSLLASLAKLDFAKPMDAVIYGYACEAIRLYGRLFPPTTVLLDWTKLIPKDATLLCRAPVAVQKMIVRSVRDAYAMQPSSYSVKHTSFRIIQHIAMTAQSQYLYEETRHIAIALLRGLDSSKESLAPDVDAARDYEAASWVDGLTEATLDEFCALLQDCTTTSTGATNCPAVVSMSRAWKNCSLPDAHPPFYASTLLDTAMRRLVKASRMFSQLVTQIVLRCMLCDTNPLPLAALVVDMADRVHSNHRSMQACSAWDSLVGYSRSLVRFDTFTDKERDDSVKKSLRQCFSINSYVRAWCDTSSSNNNNLSANEMNRYTGKDFFACAQQISHLAAVVKTKQGGYKCTELLRYILPLAVVTSSHDSIAQTLLPKGNVIAERLSMDSPGLFDIVLLSSRNQNLVEAHVDLEAVVTAAFSEKESDMGRLFSVLYSVLIRSFVPISISVSFLEQMLRHLGTRTSLIGENPLCRLTLMYLQLTTANLDEFVPKGLRAASVLSTALKTWVVLTTEKGTWEPLRLTLVVHLEEFLVGLLQKDSSALAIFQYKADFLVSRLVLSKLTVSSSRSEKEQEGCFMSTVFASDPYRFAKAFWAIFFEASSKYQYVSMFNEGIFDEASCATINCLDFHSKSSKQLVQLLYEICNGRARKLLSSPTGSQSLHGFTSVLLCFMTQLNTNRIDGLHGVVCFLEYLEKQPELLQKQDISCQEKIFELAIRVCCTRRCSSLDNLSSMVLNSLCEALPRSLRACRKERKTISTLSYTAPLHFISWLQRLLLCEQYLDLARFVDSESPSAFLRACLKCGLSMNQEYEEKLRESCLSLVRTFVAAIRSDSGLRSTEPSTTTNAMITQLLSMISTHSKFESLLESSCSTKLEALHLLKEIVSALPALNFDRELWRCLSTSFQAGTGKSDTILRQILCMYTEKAVNGGDWYHLDQLRWGEFVGQKELDARGRTWDWLPDALDLRRVYATIEKFPIHDFPVSGKAPTKTIEVDSENREVEVDTSPRDRRYSPGFLLPIILVALQSQSKSAARMDSSNRFFEQSQKGAFLQQRLCEKGGLALSLVALCSKSLVIRKISVSIISLFLQTVDSEDARNALTWRERPQLAMVLKSVQRALVLRYAEISSETPDSPGIDIPELPGFCAVFLARASLVISRPSDPLFLAMNRSFLRSEGSGGAFQDLTRLPAFMSLFCSAADDFDVLLAERSLALDLVRTGFTCEENYKLLVSCHCPELLLTSLESTKMTSLCEPVDEPTMILATILKIVSCGGDSAASHLIGRLGILPWLRSLILNHNVSGVLQKEDTQLVYLKLLAFVVRKTSGLLSHAEVSMSTSGLGELVLSLVLNGTNDGTLSKIGNVKRRLPRPMMATTCEVLTMLANVHSNSVCSQSKNGIYLSSAAQFISAVNNQNLLDSALFALCSLPVEFRQEEASLVASSFCTQVLISVAGANELQSNTKVAVIDRISFLASKDKACLDLSILLGDLISCWKVCANDEEASAAWRRCVAHIVSNVKGKRDDLKSPTVKIGCIADEISIGCWIEKIEKDKKN